MNIAPDQSVLLADNTLLEVQKLCDQDKLVYGKSLNILKDMKEFEWSGCQLTGTPFTGKEKQVSLTFGSLVILVPEYTSILSKNSNGSYSWLKATSINTQTPLVAMLFGSTVSTVSADKISRVTPESDSYISLSGRKKEPLFLGTKEKNSKSYGICLIVRDEIS